MNGRFRHTGSGTAVKIVVTGPFNAGKTTLIRTISEITVLSTERDATDGAARRRSETTVAMDFGRITVDRDLVLYLFGTPGQQRFDFMWDILGEGMLGYLLLVDAARPESVDEAAPILRTFRGKAHVPFVVAVNRTTPAQPGGTAAGDRVDPELAGRIREALELSGDVPLVPCNAVDRESVKSVLLALLYAVVDSLDAPAVAQG